MKTPITQAIDALVSEHAAPLLKQHGFRKKGQRFARNRQGCTQVVEFDRWKYNEGTYGKFGLTLGVFHAEVWAMLLQARPGWITSPFDERFPPVQNCIIDFAVLPPKEERGLDSLWAVDAQQGLDVIAAKLSRTIEGVVLPWLEDHAELKTTFGHLAEQSRKGVWLSSAQLLCAAVVARDASVAQSALTAVLEAKPSKFFPESERQAFRALAARVGAHSRPPSDAA